MKYFCGVVGNPIAHSKSPEIHAEFARRCGINLQYDRIYATEENFVVTVRDFFAKGGRGLNITIPFKGHAFSICNELSEFAHAAASVNTLFMKDGVLFGDNTDGRGLCQALAEHGVILKNTRVLLIGAGGAARGVLLPLLKSGVCEIVIANRTPEKTAALICDERISACSLQNLPLEMDLIINATSATLYGETLEVPTRAAVGYDMVYGKPILWAKNCTHVFDGYSMLIAQAKLSFCQWFKVNATDL